MIPDLKMRDIEISLIPHRQQRYPTLGDWYYSSDRKTLYIRVSEELPWPSCDLVVIHELVEALLCFQRVPQSRVDEWDNAHLDLEEPGAHPDAPYHKQHTVADIVERLACLSLPHEWSKHEEVCDRVWDKVEGLRGKGKL